MQQIIPYPSIFVIKSLLFGLLLLTGCERGEEVRAVDFSKTVTVSDPVTNARGRPVLRAAVGAMISPKETHGIYLQLLAFVSRKVEMDLEFVQRKTYAEVNEMLGQGEIDLAFICSGPYALGSKDHGFELLVAPEVQGSPVYYSYLIVNRDGPHQTLEDLRGAVFAFTDPHSNTGRLVPEYWLAVMGERPETFFRDVIYTYSHDNSIQAVAQGLVDGAAVDNLIWDYFARENPVHTARTRVIKRSAPYGIPPIVVGADMPRERVDLIRGLLLDMHTDPEGAVILGELMIDRFVPADPAWYASILELQETVRSLGEHDTP
ncbi:MAG: phosphate/phosphite/phosphonate ABC transporter substrate-binding protein [Desulfovibrionales bacterium]|nr:MAG: phosphate/phosphite/phosphonate ABC transporter substrate-binding protein [Desulfovibrionales bacterium]